jgi:myo-inositol 2-dehydrogenase/D-chiro-inositol 1-dehydrogenase
MRLAPIDVAATCDLDLDAAEAAAREAGAPLATTALDDLVAAKPDLVMIAVGPKTYPALAERVLRAGIDVYVEKPPAITVAEAERMRAVARETGRQLAVGFMKRFATGYRMAKELAGEPEFGTLTHLTARISTGVWTPVWSKELTPLAFVLDHSIHFLDLVQVFGGPVEWVCAAPSRAGDSRFGFAVLLRFTSGATGLLEISNFESRGVPNERIQLTGSTGRSVTVENVTRVTYARDALPMTAGRRLDPDTDRVVWEPNMTNISAENSSLVHMGYVGEMRNLAAAFGAHVPVKPDIDDGIAALRLAHAVLGSAGDRIALAA